MDYFFNTAPSLIHPRACISPHLSKTSVSHSLHSGMGIKTCRMMIQNTSDKYAMRRIRARAWYRFRGRFVIPTRHTTIHRYGGQTRMLTFSVRVASQLKSSVCPISCLEPLSSRWKYPDLALGQPCVLPTHPALTGLSYHSLADNLRDLPVLGRLSLRSSQLLALFFDFLIILAIISRQFSSQR